MTFDLGFIFQVILTVIRYVPITLYMAVVSLIIGGALGLVVALIRFYQVPVLSPMIGTVITILKGVPLILVFSAATQSASSNYKYFEAYIAAAVVYWLMTILIEQAAHRFELKFAKKMERARA